MPEAHLIAQALRAALAMAAPATVLLAEAIVGPDDLVAYLGRHERERRECELAYHNQLMVQCWSMVASRRADLARHASGPAPRSTAPCHLVHVRAVPRRHRLGDRRRRRRARRVQRGRTPRVPGGVLPGRVLAVVRPRGRPFGVNVETNDERTSGMTSTLAGVAAALDDDDPVALDRAVRRMLLLYGIVFGYGGIPIIYMGDELCQGDDRSYLDDPDRAADSRWTHRPVFDEERAKERNDPSTLTGRVWQGLRHLIETRKRCNPLHDDGATVRTFDAGSPAVFAWHRDHPRFGEMIGLANVGESVAVVTQHPDLAPGAIDVLAPDDRDPWRVAPLQVRWITADRDYATLPATAPPT